MNYQNVSFSDFNVSNDPLKDVKCQCNPCQCKKHKYAKCKYNAIDDRFKYLQPYLISLLENLAYVQQSAKYHPEGGALFHSLQVFECALQCSDKPILWAAALLHNVGKTIDYPNHAHVGAEELEGLVDPYICWLIRHHLDLLTSSKKTRSRLKGSAKLQDLESLRKWDLQGRRAGVEVMDVQQAIEILNPHFPQIAVSAVYINCS